MVFMAIANPIAQSNAQYQQTAGNAAVQVLSFSEVNINAQGYPIEISWQKVDALTKASVSCASFFIKSTADERQLGELNHNFTGSNQNCIITFGAKTRLKKLTIMDMEVYTAVADNDGYESVTSLSALSSGGLRLVLSIPDGRGGYTPVYCAPATPERAVLPGALIGCTFSNSVFSIPDTIVDKVRLNIVRNDQPEDFEPVAFRCSKITGIAANLPSDTKLVAPNGEIIWAYPGEFDSQNSSVMIDFRMPLQAALNDALNNNQDIDVAFSLISSNEARIKITPPSVSGELYYSIDGVNRTELFGEAIPVLLKDKLSPDTPDEVNADLTVSYNGIRILEEASDDVPDKTGDIAGMILGSKAFSHKFYPPLSKDYPVALIGIIGRAPVSCELEIQIGTLAGQTLFTPACPGKIIKIESGQLLHTAWADFQDTELSLWPDALSVKAVSGRFFWVCDPNPLIRFAVFDPDPKGRPLFIDGFQILAIEETSIHLPANVFPNNSFKEKNPVLSSSLFCTVDLSDIKLRYNR